METGTIVRAKTFLQSDDAALGLDPNGPTVEAGTLGKVLGKSEDFLESGCTMKSTNCYVVEFPNVNFDVTPDEVEVVP